jgi:hypothetical protein
MSEKRRDDAQPQFRVHLSRGRWSLLFRQQSFAGTLAERGSILLSAATTAGGPDWCETHIADKAGTRTKNNISIPTKFRAKNVFLFIVCRTELSLH